MRRRSASDLYERSACDNEEDCYANSSLHDAPFLVRPTKPGLACVFPFARQGYRQHTPDHAQRRVHRCRCNHFLGVGGNERRPYSEAQRRGMEFLFPLSRGPATGRVVIYARLPKAHSRRKGRRGLPRLN